MTESKQNELLYEINKHTAEEATLIDIGRQFPVLSVVPDDNYKQMVKMLEALPEGKKYTVHTIVDIWRLSDVLFFEPYFVDNKKGQHVLVISSNKYVVPLDDDSYGISDSDFRGCISKRSVIDRRCIGTDAPLTNQYMWNYLALASLAYQEDNMCSDGPFIHGITPTLSGLGVELSKLQECLDYVRDHVFYNRDGRDVFVDPGLLIGAINVLFNDKNKQCKARLIIMNDSIVMISYSDKVDDMIKCIHIPSGNKYRTSEEYVYVVWQLCILMLQSAKILDNSGSFNAHRSVQYVNAVYNGAPANSAYALCAEINKMYGRKVPESISAMASAAHPNAEFDKDAVVSFADIF